MIFELEPTFWKRHWFSSLNTCDLLNLLQTCRFFQKHKIYIYKLIFIITYRQAETIVSSHIQNDPVLYSQIKITDNTILDSNKIKNESVIELIKITKLFLDNRELKKFIIRRSRSKYSIDIKFAMLFKKYFMDCDSCTDTCETDSGKKTQMEKFLNNVFNNEMITCIKD